MGTKKSIQNPNRSVSSERRETSNKHQNSPKMSNTILKGFNLSTAQHRGEGDSLLLKNFLAGDSGKWERSVQPSTRRRQRARARRTAKWTLGWRGTWTTSTFALLQSATASPASRSSKTETTISSRRMKTTRSKSIWPSGWSSTNRCQSHGRRACQSTFDVAQHRQNTNLTW